MKSSQPTDCSQEPITIPGAVQSHGLLLVLHSETFIIEQVSENSLPLLGIPARELLGTDARRLVAPRSKESFVNLVAEAAENYVNPFEVKLQGAEKNYLHCTGIANSIQENITLLELEPLELDGTNTRSLENYFQLVQNSLQLSSNLTSASQIAELMAEKVKDFTGFDRVMIYKFSEDGSGQVIAEEAAAGMEPYLHLRYPASDIPPQARELYLKNWVRLLRDVDGEVSSIIPLQHPRLEAPTPLDKSVLRSVSPIHLQYLRNMGVQATLTISLVVDGKLWGLIACHHRSPRFVPYGIRATSSLYGVVMSAQLARAESAQDSLDQAICEQATAKLLSRLDANEDIVSNFTRSLPALLEIFQADGAAFLSNKKSVAVGNCPADPILKKIATQLAEKEKSEIVVTDKLTLRFPEFESALPQAAGVITFPLGYDSWIVILRDEFESQIRWGGDPNSSKADPTGRLSPRASFAEWTETISGCSKPWPNYVTNLVDELRSGLSGFVIAKNQILESRNEELHRFASVVAHEVKSQLQPPLLALSLLQEQSNSGKLADMLELGITSLTTLSEFTSEMLSFAQLDKEEAEPTEVNFEEIARRAADQAVASLPASRARTVVHPLPRRRASASQSHHLFLNLIRNAIIHGPEEGQDNFRVEVGSQEAGSETYFYVRDNGRGIPEHDHERIFEYFHQGDGGGRAQGSGIGLGFARRALARTGDRIWVESKLGKGATFFFTLGED